MWADAIHNSEFVKGLLTDVKKSPSGTYHTLQRITGLLTVISEVSKECVSSVIVQTILRIRTFTIQWENVKFC